VRIQTHVKRNLYKSKKKCGNKPKRDPQTRPVKVKKYPTERPTAYPDKSQKKSVPTKKNL